MSQPLRVLHVEDAPDFRVIVAKHLKTIPNSQFEIECVDGEAEAVDRCNVSPCDLAIVDYELKDGDGLSCVSRLRSIDTYLPIIAISGRASDEIACDLLRAGVDDYFDKTKLRRDSFQQAVLAALERARNWRDSRSHLMVGTKVLERRLAVLHESIRKFAEGEIARQIPEIVETARKAGYDQQTLRVATLTAAKASYDPPNRLRDQLWSAIQSELERAIAPASLS